MSSQVITIKVDALTKKQAQDTAKQLGLSLGAFINRVLKHSMRSEIITLSRPDEIPNAYFKRTLKKAEKNLKEGKTSPVFDNIEDNLAWLEKQGI